jgi:tetratricopeptide (TPR) repeat protein
MVRFCFYWTGLFPLSALIPFPVGLNPADAAAYYNRGYVYSKKAEYDRVRADWTEALRLNPSDTNSRNNLETLRQNGYWPSLPETGVTL